MADDGNAREAARPNRNRNQEQAVLHHLRLLQLVDTVAIPLVNEIPVDSYTRLCLDGDAGTIREGGRTRSASRKEFRATWELDRLVRRHWADYSVQMTNHQALTVVSPNQDYCKYTLPLIALQVARHDNHFQVMLGVKKEDWLCCIHSKRTLGYYSPSTLKFIP